MEFRALYPEELETWLDHVTTVFTGGRKYFSNHWHNDPWRDPEGIRIALDKGTIVSTARVFLRKMFLHGEPITVGGIGEVSTRPEYRRRGLATQLLKDAIRFMEDREIAMSSLHGSQRIYSIEGWEKVPRYHARQPFSAEKRSKWEVRRVNFDDEAEVKRIAELYDGYARKFNGTFVRDESTYWTEWVRTESPNAWVAERNGNIEGYISLYQDGNKLNVEEFIASEPSFEKDKGKELFESMLSNVIAQMDMESFEVVYPAPIADGFNASAIEERGSTMYRINQSSVLSDAFNSIPDLLHNQPQPLSQDIQSHHVFWYTDGY
ncbi:hypothetical protein C6496_07245 [Candidatus Poribacteria bacterium]|nr:MAG: hypothetical protein C6496_07245 [Candidatus Poribacteria bacterium]